MMLRRAGLTVSAVAALAALTACSAGSAPVPRPAGRPLHALANFDPSMAGWVACSKLIVSGDVVAVADDAPGYMRTRLRVRAWLKPAHGPRFASIITRDIAADGQYRRWTAGQHLLLRVDVDPTALPDWQFGPGMEKRIRAAAPQARTLDCPYGPAAGPQ